MVITANLGFPRIGVQRELKRAQESFWSGAISEQELQNTGAELRKRHWNLQKEAGISHIPSNDFSFYDHVLDTIAMVGAIPERYGFKGGNVSLELFFAMARGSQGKGRDVTAMEMTKWMDTNYHYIVPELRANQEFKLSSTKAVDQFEEAKKLGIITRPVLVGPVSFLLLGKAKEAGFNTLSLLPKLLPVYAEVLKKLEAAGAEWVQIDEPCLVQDLSDASLKAFTEAYASLAKASGLKIVLATYFERLSKEAAKTVFALPVTAVHLDLVRGASQLDEALEWAGKDKILSLGVVDGRNIWKTDLERAYGLLEKAVKKLGTDRVMVAPSCSLLHSPVDLREEKLLDAEIKSWLAFATQKLEEIALLGTAINKGKDAAGKAWQENQQAVASRKTSKRIHNDAVKKRVAGLNASSTERHSKFEARRKVQQEKLKLPVLPSTTIGSFPQTKEVREARAQFKAGKITAAAYETFLKKEIEATVRRQEKIGIDVLVHGEFERNDMVEYFGEQLSGFAFTQNGWVQSYGSRAVKPPIIFGDVTRPKPMTVAWSQYAQSLTSKIMKGMLTGPVTILQWSFVRDDQPRSDTCRQISLAIRDEVVDLEKAGIQIIQIDEAAIREGLPLKKADWKAYLNWAVECFRISAGGVEDRTQIHTHMCYSEFNDIIAAVADMDADVISIETSRSQMELLEAFVNFKYPNEIGPGVYDIHSPRVPTKEEMKDLLHKALKVLSADQIWVNPDCGLKTRGWPEVEASLVNMQQAVAEIRAELDAQKKLKVSA